MQKTKKVSLRIRILESIGNFLFEEGFITDGYIDGTILKEGILQVINLLSDYHEEGRALFPEVLITNNREFLKTIAHKEISIEEKVPISVEAFNKVIKLCAPLATNSWIIFIEVKARILNYGIVSAEISETTPSMYHQTVGKFMVEYDDTKIAYIRNIRQKTVELSGFKKKLQVILTLDAPKKITSNEVYILSEEITFSCDIKYKNNICSFFEKIIDDALKNGHGNLIGVVEDSSVTIERLKKEIGGKGGVYLPTALDFEEYVTLAEETKDVPSSINLKNFASVFKTMLNHDGITIVSDKGRVIGYHILIPDYTTSTDIIEGGTRSKAFKSMQNCGYFKFCFFKSQDGNIKTWKK